MTDRELLIWILGALEQSYPLTFEKIIAAIDDHIHREQKSTVRAFPAGAAR